MLEKTGNRQALVDNDNSTSGRALITKIISTKTNKIMEKPAVASE